MSDGFYRAFEERYRGSRELIKGRLEAYRPFFLPLRNISPIPMALDLGCGRGEWLELLNENGFSTYGIDFDAEMLKACQELGLNVLQGDAIQFLRTVPNESYSVVSAFHVVEHISFDELRTLIAEALRVLQPGGVLILETPNPENIVVATRDFYLDPSHQRPIPAPLLTFLAEFTGFERIKTLRLQESKELVNKEKVSLQDVFSGASPDYAVIAQKGASSAIFGSLDEPFKQEYGLSFDQLINRWDTHFDHLEIKLQEAENRAQEASAEALAIRNSTFWQITAPLRWAVGGLRRLLCNESRLQTKFIIKKAVLYLNDFLFFKKTIQIFLNYFPSIKKRIIFFLNQDSSFTIKLDLASSTSRARNIYIDVSGVAREDLRTGIQRVIRGLLLGLSANIPSGYAIQPVYAQEKKLGYCHARKFTRTLLQGTDDLALDEPIEPEIGDIFLGLDFQVHALLSQKPYLDRLHQQGLKVYFVVYDLLPVHSPNWFYEVTHKGHLEWLQVINQYDGAICISQSVANDLKVWRESNFQGVNNPFAIEWFHLGADINQTQPTNGLPEKSKSILSIISKSNSFLMVGTIEPRKGHAQVIAAFELLWSEGQDARLVIVGKQGWMVEDVIDKIKKNNDINNKIIWLDGISDEYLDRIYKSCTCLIAASEGEGFGLPLIEAAQYKIPIIARDIKVFREVAKDCAYYFNTKSPELLAGEIKTWLRLYELEQHPKSTTMPWLTWNESANQLLRKLPLI